MLNYRYFLLFLLLITICYQINSEEFSINSDKDDDNYDDANYDEDPEEIDTMKKSKIIQQFLLKVKSNMDPTSDLQKRDELIVFESDNIFDDITDADRKIIPKIKRVNEQETPETIEAKRLVIEGRRLLNLTKPNEKQAYFLFEKAAEIGNLDAKAELAWAELLGKPLPQNITNAIETFKFLANQGHPDGHMAMGFLHATGIVMPFSQARAIVYYSLAAAAGHRMAKYALAYRYHYGINIGKYCDSALEIYMQLAENVIRQISFANTITIHKIRLLDEFESDAVALIADHNLISYYELMTEKGDTAAQIILGQMYYQGATNIQVDYVKARHYYEMAANAKNVMGMAYLGKLYLLDNDEVKPDYSKARHYLSMAAEEKNSVALTGLGYMYLYGLGMEVNYVLALKNFLAAVNEKSHEAHFYVGLMYFEGLGVEKSYEHASFHFQNAVLAGHILAVYYLAKMYATGLNGYRSCPKAADFYKTVIERDRYGLGLNRAYHEFKNNKLNEAYMQYALYSELGYEIAQSNLAFMLRYYSIPLLNNYNKSHMNQLELMYWSRAASQGYSLARLRVGDCYYYGRGTAIDYEMAAAMYRIAADQLHNSQAMFNLGYMHEHGIGIKRDLHLAKRYYDLAVEFNNDAKIPCFLALIKLYIISFLERLYIRPIDWFFYFTDGINIYITLLIGLFVIYLEIYYGHLL